MCRARRQSYSALPGDNRAAGAGRRASTGHKYYPPITILPPRRRRLAAASAAAPLGATSAAAPLGAASATAPPGAASAAAPRWCASRRRRSPSRSQSQSEAAAAVRAVWCGVPLTDAGRLVVRSIVHALPPPLKSNFTRQRAEGHARPTAYDYRGGRWAALGRAIALQEQARPSTPSAPPSQQAHHPAAHARAHSALQRSHTHVHSTQLTRPAFSVPVAVLLRPRRAGHTRLPPPPSR